MKTFIKTMKITLPLRGVYELIRTIISRYKTNEFSKIRILNDIKSEINSNTKIISLLPSDKKNDKLKDKLQKKNEKLLVSYKIIKKMSLSELKNYVTKQNLKISFMNIIKTVMMAAAVRAASKMMSTGKSMASVSKSIKK